MGNSDQRAAGARIFICYRRDDSGDITDRIYDRLIREFPGAVFRDLDAIPFGVDFRNHISGVLETCQIVLAVIGPEWLTVKSNSGERRIDDPRDHVRIEIEAALARNNVRVIPLVVRDTKVPLPENLPEEIEALAYRNGHSIRRDPDFRTDMDRLIRQMRRDLKQSPAQPDPDFEDEGKRRKSWWKTVPGILAGITVLIAAFAIFLMGQNPDPPSSDKVNFISLGDGGCRTDSGAQGQFKRVKNVNLAQCKEECRQFSRCNAIEYNFLNRVCSLHYGDKITRASKENSGNAKCFKVTRS